MISSKKLVYIFLVAFLFAAIGFILAKMGVDAGRYIGITAVFIGAPVPIIGVIANLSGHIKHDLDE